MIHLKSITVRPTAGPLAEQFPFCLPLIRSLGRLEFTAPVTFLVGENGSGKSTLLEAIACSVGAVTVGSESVGTDPTLAAVRNLGKSLKQSWTKRTRKGFFLRAEDFFGYAKRLAEMREAAEGAVRAVDEAYEGRSELAKNLAKMPHRSTIGALEGRYGAGLDAGSHGENFLKLFQSRVVPGGLYLLDEPEVPLSPLRQLALLSLLKDMVDRDCQFLIATHSPILMAFPGATILNCDVLPPAPTAYGELEHVTLTRSFLNEPERYLRQL